MKLGIGLAKKGLGLAGSEKARRGAARRDRVSRKERRVTSVSPGEFSEDLHWRARALPCHWPMHFSAIDLRRGCSWGSGSSFFEGGPRQ